MNVKKFISKLESIKQTIEKAEDKINKITKNVHKDYKLSAKNLIRYIILRTFDLRTYHDQLSEFGVSSLRTSEGYVYSNVYNVVRNMKLIHGLQVTPKPNVSFIGFKKYKKLIRKHANLLFNATQKRHFTEIMVTLPLATANNKQLIREMAIQGMEIARINLCHGKMNQWRKMVAHVKEVSEELSMPIKIYMDLPGPKIKTCEIEIVDKNGKHKNSMPVRMGEHILLTKNNNGGKKSKFSKDGRQIKKGEIGLSLHQIIDKLQITDQVMFDEGMVRAVVIGKTKNNVEIVITDCFQDKISSGKGINLPNKQMVLPALTQQDIQLLPFVCQYADLIGYSFIRTPQDITKLYQHLSVLNAKDIGVIFKIETKEAFDNLPEILIEGMKRNKIGVMIARGDLAINVGFERISELQNEILWLCEAAHIPVIWATQVLENLTQTGIPTRAEISDAAKGVCAECVMLNEGPYIIKAIKALKDILIRMESHSFKKKNALRKLDVATLIYNRLVA